TRSQLRIVTFNYDRSLEHFLFNAIGHTHNLDEGSTAEIIGKLPIVHVYGQLGNLPWQGMVNGRVRSYSGQTVSSTVRTARDQIHLVTEGEQAKARLVLARQWL